MKFVYFIYETKNNITGNFYIGSHKAKSIYFDGYLGSGKKLKYSIQKYGIEAFDRKILEIITYTDKSISRQEWLNLIYPVETKWILKYKSEGKILYNICTDGAFGGNTTNDTKWCYDPITNEHKMLYEHQILPDGWIFGRRNCNNPRLKGYKLYTNMITKEETRFLCIPDLTVWKLGSEHQKTIRNGSNNPSFGKKWYKSINTNQYYYGFECIPGFILGCPNWNSPNLEKINP